MIRIICSSTFLLLCVIAVQAQRIYFCSNYTSTGEPIQAGSVWNINSGGGNVYILYQNGGRAMNSATVSFYIDYLSGSEYKVWDTKVVNTSATYTWQVLDYKFTSAGSYRVAVWFNGIEAAKEYVTIKNNTSSTSGTTGSTTTTTPTSTSYYTGSSVSPGTDINLTSGLVYNMNGPFSLNTSNVCPVYFKVSNGDKKIGTNKLIVDIFKLNSSGNYDFYATKYYDISDLNWVYFYYDFSVTGTYRVSVYNATSVWINTTYVTINSNSGSGGTVPSTGNAGSTDSYSGSSIIAGTEIDASSGYVYGTGGRFKRQSSTNKAEVVFKVSNGSKNLGTTKLIVDLWKMNSSGTYEVYTTRNFDIKDLNWIYFKYTFQDPGSYKVMVYNGNSKWINTVYLTID